MSSVKLLFFCLSLMSLSISVSAQDWLWAHRAGGGYYEAGNAIATDPEGNAYVTGSFYGEADFGNINLTSSSPDFNDIFVGKLDSEGNWLWVAQAGGLNDDFGEDIALDSEGNVYVTGEFTVTAAFGSQSVTSNGQYDIFIAKLNPAGNWLWVRSAGGGSSDDGSALDLDTDANVYVTGKFYGDVSFGTTELSSAGSYDVFVTKLDSSGNWQWAAQAGGSGIDGGLGLSTYPGGTSVVTGQFRSTANFGSISITALGSSSVADIFIAKISSAGVWQWAVRAGGTSNDVGEDVELDSAGNVYLAGYINGSVTLGTTTLNGAGGNDILAAKLDPDGNWLWAKRAGSTALDIGMEISLDADANLYMTGYFSGTAEFSSGTLTSLGSTDIFAAKFDPNGNWMWYKRAGGTSSDSGYGVAVHDSSNIFFTGKFNGTADFGAHSISCGYLLDPDIYVAKLGYAAAIPKPPANIMISQNGGNVILDWDPVTQDINGQPLTPDAYYVYVSAGEDPYGRYDFLDQAAGTEFTHLDATIGHPVRFYRVTAVKN